MLFALGNLIIISTCPVSGSLSGVSRRLRSTKNLDFLGCVSGGGRGVSTCGTLPDHGVLAVGHSTAR